jgi:hypothetical protein
MFHVGGTSRRAHRVAYELAVGPIPPGLQVDHLCRVRDCVNPAHLDPVTKRENNLRSKSPFAEAARATHCANSHPFSPENLANEPGRRCCKTCKAEYARRTKENRKRRAA